MSLLVNTNQSSLSSQRLLNQATSGLSSSSEKLASGFKINRAADDAAGLVISNRLTTQIGGLEQAARNAGDAISLIQVADSALDEVTGALQKMRVLTIQSANGINNADDIEALQKEFSALRESIQAISANTEFGGLKVLDGSAGNRNFLVGANAGQTITVNLNHSFSTADTGLDIDSINFADDEPHTVIAALDSAIMLTDNVRTALGAQQNILGSTLRTISNIGENVSVSRSQLRDTDYAKETAELTRTQILQQSSTTVLAQANQRPQAALSVLAG
ncbi:flagellin [Rheinheimera hassiensis]|uniref:flagellin N-terminal helical domain-containing protein n=1 Tax=Rheinheimera hassiensis TaxID=1193627 RepID=UPI001F05AB9A|nr:flagellin [Rheinheimera hassiensis]